MVNDHIDALAKKRLQTLRIDDYNQVDSSKWNKEVQYFVNTVIYKSLTPPQRNYFAEKIDYFGNEIIEKMVREASIEMEKGICYNESMSPIDFEHFCANELRNQGWKADVTQASGDQGVDVIAKKNGLVVAIQCKKYSSPVGNGAVQEISAAKHHVMAQYAAVVSNAGFTKSAQQLARTNKVLLLHFSELKKLDEVIETSYDL